jgi:hypothetical protein
MASSNSRGAWENGQRSLKKSVEISPVATQEGVGRKWEKGKWRLQGSVGIRPVVTPGG